MSIQDRLLRLDSLETKSEGEIALVWTCAKEYIGKRML